MMAACHGADRQEFAAKEALRTYRQLMEDKVAAAGALSVRAGARLRFWSECMYVYMYSQAQVCVCPWSFRTKDSKTRQRWLGYGVFTQAFGEGSR